MCSAPVLAPGAQTCSCPYDTCTHICRTSEQAAEPAAVYSLTVSRRESPQPSCRRGCASSEASRGGAFPPLPPPPGGPATLGSRPSGSSLCPWRLLASPPLCLCPLVIGHQSLDCGHILLQHGPVLARSRLQRPCFQIRSRPPGIWPRTSMYVLGERNPSRDKVSYENF